MSVLGEFIFEDESGPEDGHAFGGIWTIIKLGVFEKYLGAFNTALSKQSFTRIYIDAFAGTGRCDIKVDGEKTSIDGSARRALNTSPAFHKYCFIELRPKKLAALKALETEHPSKTIEVIQSDANAALKALCTQYQWRSERAVLFLDPFGMHVEWSTLEAIAKTGAIDVWYLFPYCGGNMERPAVKRLLADIEKGVVDVVVVYKIDRLTRSLTDFSRMVEVFERRGVSFVSVTQQFNTTTSMGRLMLNVLLSLAQFEREVTGERIRDKIAASKRKGMWVGGVPMLGYDVISKKLVINEKEAKLVQHVFRRFTELGSTTKLVRELQLDGATSNADFAESERLFRLIVNGVFGDRERCCGGAGAGGGVLLR